MPQGHATDVTSNVVTAVNVKGGPRTASLRCARMPKERNIRFLCLGEGRHLFSSLCEQSFPGTNQGNMMMAQTMETQRGLCHHHSMCTVVLGQFPHRFSSRLVPIEWSVQVINVCVSPYTYIQIFIHTHTRMREPVQVNQCLCTHGGADSCAQVRMNAHPRPTRHKPTPVPCLAPVCRPPSRQLLPRVIRHLFPFF